MSEKPPTQGNEDENREQLLPGIDGPEDLHGLDDEQLQQVAQEMRTYIIDTIGEIGGHFGANLGTCELASESHAKATTALAEAGGDTDDLGRVADYIFTRHE